MTNASYVAWIDVFMMANLLAVLSVWIYQKYKFGFLWGSIPLVLSLSLYQCYSQVTVIIILILLVQQILDGDSPQKVIRDGVKAICLCLLSLLAYAFLLWLLLCLFKVDAVNSYNGIAGILQFTDQNPLRLILYTGIYTLYTFLNPMANIKPLVIVINVCVGIATLIALFQLARAKHLKKGSLFLLALIVILMPFGVDYTFLISKGNIHTLTKYGMFFFYLFALWVFQQRSILRAVTGGKHQKWAECVALALLAIVVWDNVIYANQLYLKKDLEYQATELYMNRVISRVEEAPGYIPGETPVVFVGNVEDSKLLREREGLDRFTGPGIETASSITYYDTISVYCKSILGYPIRILDEKTAKRYALMPEVEAMEPFPAKTCCAMIGDVLAVKVADEKKAAKASSDTISASKALQMDFLSMLNLFVQRVFKAN